MTLRSPFCPSLARFSNSDRVSQRQPFYGRSRAPLGTACRDRNSTPETGRVARRLPRAFVYNANMNANSTDGADKGGFHITQQLF